MNNEIIVINPLKSEEPFSLDGLDNRKRVVAAYCRVSTDEDEQMNSYENQVKEWTERISKNPNYTLYKVYGDGGISGTTDKQREEFQQMISDAEEGKFDLILCKSISRFARNTVLTLSTIKKLKDIGVEVFFDNERMSTFDSKTELIFTIMSSMAQEESRHISDNVKWAFRILMEHGNAFGPGPMGYIVKEIDGIRKYVVVPEEAEIVKKIFNLYDTGYGCTVIANILTSEKIPTKTGHTRWHPSVIIDMLKNPTYKGELLLQKTYTKDFMSHSRLKNRGQRKMFKWIDAHEAIISKEQWQRVNDSINASFLKTAGKDIVNLHKYSSRTALSGLLLCGLCFKKFKRRHWYDKSYKEPRITYQCDGYVNAPRCERCQSKAISENVLYAGIADMLNNLYANQSPELNYLKEAFVQKYHLKKSISDIEEFKKLIDLAKAKIKDIRIRKAIEENEKKREALEVEEDVVFQQYNNLETKYQRLKIDKSLNEIRSNAFAPVLSLFEGHKINRESLKDFPIRSIIECIRVIDKGTVIFFINVTNTLSKNEKTNFFRSKRIKDFIFENSVTIKNPTKRDTLKYYVKSF